MDRQESVVHSRLHRRVSHGAVSLCFRTGQNTGTERNTAPPHGALPGSSTRSSVKSRTRSSPAMCGWGWIPQAPALTECAGHWRQRRGQNPRLCQAQHSGSKQQLCDHGPKMEVLTATGGYLKRQGYDIRVLNLVDLSQSDGYNPFRYLRDEKDALKLVNTLIQATTPKAVTSPIRSGRSPRQHCCRPSSSCCSRKRRNMSRIFHGDACAGICRSEGGR